MKTFTLILIASMLWLTGCKNKQQTGEHAMPVPEILVHTPAIQDVTYTYEYPAYLEAEQTVNLVARVSGFLEQINYTPGRSVKSGDLLFVIEPKPYADQVSAAESQVKSAEAQLAYAKASYEKMKEAMKTKAVSEIDYIQAESSYNSALAGLQNAQSQLNNARINLEYCYIRAPFDGKVSRNMMDKANFVSGGVQPVTLATMYKDRRMYSYFNMAYAEYQNLPPVRQMSQPGDSLYRITLTDASNPGMKWNGKLDYTSPNVDLQTGTVNVRAIVDNPGEELISGMYVKISVPYKRVKNALLIPETSISTNQAGRFVYVVDKDNRIELKPVVVGALEPSGMRQIVSGVDKDSRYVVEALMNVRPGMKVKPVTR